MGCVVLFAGVLYAERVLEQVLQEDADGQQDQDQEDEGLGGEQGDRWAHWVSELHAPHFANSLLLLYSSITHL